MKRSWVFWLGLVGLLGFVGPLVTGKTYMAIFLWFFTFFGWSAIGRDERLEVAIGLACRNALIAGIVAFAAAAFTLAMQQSPTILMPYAFAGAFAVQILTFSLSLVVYNHTSLSS